MDPAGAIDAALFWRLHCSCDDAAAAPAQPPANCGKLLAGRNAAVLWYGVDLHTVDLLVAAIVLSSIIVEVPGRRPTLNP